MNLWVKKVKLLLIGAVLLLFFSCEEDTSLLGYRNPNKKYSVNYVEIPLESSVLFFDSLRTSNYFFSGEKNRLLAGTYLDPDLGKITTSAYSQFFRTGQLDDSLNFATFDSVTLQLAFDFYYYGESITSDQSISIFELGEELTYDSIGYYYNDKNPLLEPTPLGNKTFTFNPGEIENYLAIRKDTTLSIRMPLDAAFGTRIMDLAAQFSAATSRADSAFYYYSDFVKIFKGIAIIPQTGDKIIGFNPSANSKITVYYHINQSDSLEFRLSGVPGFSNIQADRSATELATLSQPFMDFYPASDLRYIESGVGIFTKLDFTPYLQFCDTIPQLIINSAELSIEGIQTDPNLHVPPPSELVLRVLKPSNRFKTYSRLVPKDEEDRRLYGGTIDFEFESIASGATIIAEKDSTFTVNGDNRYTSRFLRLPFNKEKSSYQGFLTLFAQELFDVTENKTRFNQFLLFPSSPNVGKSVNRAVFGKNNIKLKLYYTLPK